MSDGRDSHNSGMPFEPRVLILAKKPEALKSTANFLVRRGVPTLIVKTLNDAIERMSKKEANIILLSMNFPHPKVEMIPPLVAQSFQVETIVFVEQSDRKLEQKMANSKAKHMMYGNPSGPSVLIRVRQIEKEKNGNSDEEEVTLDKKESASRDGAGKDNDGRIIMNRSGNKNSSNDSGSIVLSGGGNKSNENGADYGYGSLEPTSDANDSGIMIQKGQRSKSHSATQGSAGDGDYGSETQDGVGMGEMHSSVQDGPDANEHNTWQSGLSGNGNKNKRRNKKRDDDESLAETDDDSELDESLDAELGSDSDGWSSKKSNSNEKKTKFKKNGRPETEGDTFETDETESDEITATSAAEDNFNSRSNLSDEDYNREREKYEKERKQKKARATQADSSADSDALDEDQAAADFASSAKKSNDAPAAETPEEKRARVKKERKAKARAEFKAKARSKALSEGKSEEQAELQSETEAALADMLGQLDTNDELDDENEAATDGFAKSAAKQAINHKLARSNKKQHESSSEAETEPSTAENKSSSDSSNDLTQNNPKDHLVDTPAQTTASPLAHGGGLDPSGFDQPLNYADLEKLAHAGSEDRLKQATHHNQQKSIDEIYSHLKPEEKQLRMSIWDSAEKALWDASARAATASTEIIYAESMVLVTLRVSEGGGCFTLMMRDYKDDVTAIFEQFRQRLLVYLGEIALNVSAHDCTMNSVDPENFPKEFIDQGERYLLLNCSDMKLAMSFMPLLDVVPSIDIKIEDSMATISLEDIKPGDKLTFDAYIHLKQNNKFLRYLKKGFAMTQEQSQRLAQFEIKHFFVRSEEIEAFKQFFVANKMKWALEQRKNETVSKNSKAA